MLIEEKKIQQGNVEHVAEKRLAYIFIKSEGQRRKDVLGEEMS